MSEAITTPVGRLVQGSLYKANTTDAQGNPLTIKHGANAGQPRQDFYFAVAIPKGQEQHWNQTPWGLVIWNEAVKSWPQGQYNSPAFSWKIEDGDSQTPNKKGKKPCDQEGFPGHWVLRFSSGYAPQVYNRDGSQQIMEEGAVKLGYYVEVNGTVAGNDNAGNPGVYLNHRFVALAGYGDEIRVGPSAAEAGFGKAPLPAGASAAPVGGQFNPAPAQGGVTTTNPPLPASAPVGAVMPVAGTVNAGTVGVASIPPSVAAAPPPNPAILQAPVVPQMTAKAAGATYEQFTAQGWTDEQLRQHGYLA